MTRYEIHPDRSEVRIEARSSIHPIEAVTHGLEGFFEAELDEGGLLDLSVPPTGRLELPVGSTSWALAYRRICFSSARSYRRLIRTV